MKLFVGIDPGAKGGIAFLKEDGGLLGYYPMPLNSEGIVCEKQLWDLFSRNLLEHELLVFIERVGPFPGAAAKSNWTFSQNVCIPRVVLSLLDVPVSYIEPKAWLSGLGLVKTKDNPKPSVAWCRDIYGLITKDGISDSIAIGRYALLKILLPGEGQ